MTTNDTTRTMRDGPNHTMRAVSHTNPYTNETVGQLFSRGPIVVTDGGERADGSRASSEHRSDGGEPSETRRTSEDAGSSGGERASSEHRSDGSEPVATDSDEPREPTRGERMRDVDHTPPHDADDANRVFERGRKPAQPDRDSVVAEE